MHGACILQRQQSLLDTVYPPLAVLTHRLFFNAPQRTYTYIPGVGAIPRPPTTPPPSSPAPRARRHLYHRPQAPDVRDVSKSSEPEAACSFAMAPLAAAHDVATQPATTAMKAPYSSTLEATASCFPPAASLRDMHESTRGPSSSSPRLANLSGAQTSAEPEVAASTSPPTRRVSRAIVLGSRAVSVALELGRCHHNGEEKRQSEGGKEGEGGGDCDYYDIEVAGHDSKASSSPQLWVF
jgi:hypothetical protein